MFTFCCPYSAADVDVDHDWAQLVHCIDGAGVRVRRWERKGGPHITRVQTWSQGFKRDKCFNKDYFEPRMPVASQSIFAVMNNVWNPLKYFSLICPLCLTTGWRKFDFCQLMSRGRLKQTPSTVGISDRTPVALSYHNTRGGHSIVNTCIT